MIALKGLDNSCVSVNIPGIGSDTTCIGTGQNGGNNPMVNGTTGGNVGNASGQGNTGSPFDNPIYSYLKFIYYLTCFGLLSVGLGKQYILKRLL